jgi:hypothetical protein
VTPHSAAAGLVLTSDYLDQRLHGGTREGGTHSTAAAAGASELGGGVMLPVLSPTYCLHDCGCS